MEDTLFFADMMYFLYYGILLICLITSIRVYKYNVGFRLFTWILGVELMEETLAMSLAFGIKTNPYIVYHLGMPIAYCLTSYFFSRQITSTRVRKIIYFSMVLFVAVSAMLTVFFYRFDDFPGLTFNLNGTFLILISSYVMLTLDPVYHIPIYKHPLAWICVGIIVFYTGTFFLNGIYNYLVKTKDPNTTLIHQIINNGLNLFMYSCYITGLFCSHALKKYASAKT